MQLPEISIVIPTFNERENVVGLLPAVGAALAGTSFEIVVVDDGSPDGTSDAVLRMTAQLPVWNWRLVNLLTLILSFPTLTQKTPF